MTHLEMPDDLAFQPQIGQICQWTGEVWEPLTGPGAEEDTSTAFGALDTLLSALDTLRSTDTIDIPIPGPAERWSEALLAADGAYATLAMVLEELEAELDRQHSRDTDADAYRDPDPDDEVVEEEG